MLPSFSATADPYLAKQRVAHLRKLMTAQKLDAYLVPHADEHQNEFLPNSAERLKWLTGFSGSAGMAVIGLKKAALFIDGRYTLQVQAECDASLFDFLGPSDKKPTEWILSHLKKGATIGFDPWLHTINEITKMTSELTAKGLKLKAISKNLVDRAWGKERPPSSLNPVVLHPLDKAGQKAEKKIADLQSLLSHNSEDCVLLTALDSIAWLFNIRGSDIAHTPVALAFAYVPSKGKPELFIDPLKVPKAEKKKLEEIVSICPPKKMKERLNHLRRTKKTVRIDPHSVAFALERGLSDKCVSYAPDPCVRMKALKNATEIAGTRSAHVRDGVALVRFLSWFYETRPKTKLDEITIVHELQKFRAQNPLFKDVSFSTIAGSGPNGAIVHYRVTEKTNRILEKGDLLLLDSGAQYEDGTTDITRTLAMGTPSEEIQQRATLVLKGHIAIATANFPQGTRGIDLDSLARKDLWKFGLDYNHGTGHGVGSYLSVHEKPQSISRTGMATLEPGMICSNEPGYYKQGAYGIRIENLVLVTEPLLPDKGDKPMMGFETLTLVPFDRTLILEHLLTKAEVDWINQYHKRVLDALSPHLEPSVLDWLQQATSPLQSRD